jgi:hypothetical protein
MDFKLVSKNNIGTVVLLLLVIALSQAKTFNFLIDTALGRFFLIVFILCLSYCHKIFGVVGVLFIIIMFNSNIYYEGFENKSDPNIDATTMEANADKIKHVVTKKIIDASNNITTDDSNDTTISNNTTNDDKIKNVTVAKTVKDSKAAEGFDILGIENNIKRGKQSNSIPVNNFMRDADSVAPYDSSSFLGSFSLF